jgi:CBS domain-containing protein
MKVEKLMSKDVRWCSPDQSLRDAAGLMWERDCGCVPIVDEGRVVGMITDRDICIAALFQGRPLAEIPINQSMSRDILACRADDEVGSAEATMQRAQVRRLPVTDGIGRLVGILSLNDIAREAARQQMNRTPEIGLHDVAITLGAVSQRARGSAAATTPAE